MIFLESILFCISMYILINVCILIYFYVKDWFSNDIVLAKNNLSVSILIPAHNEELVIGNTIKSIMETKYDGEVEIIVIAHNCTDNTANIARKLGVMVLESNIGKTKGHALNQGFKISKNDVVIVIDADTYIPKDYLQKTIPLMSKYDGLQTEVRIYNTKEGFLAKMTDIEFRVHGATKQYLGSKGNFATLGGNGQFLKRTVLDIVGGWSDSLADDTELSCRVLKAGYKIGFCDSTYVLQEAVTNLTQYVNQRARWGQGNTLIMKDTLKLSGIKKIHMFFSVNGILFSPFVKLSNIMFIIGLFDTISFDFISTNYSLFCLPYFTMILLGMIRAKINIFNIFPYYIYSQLIYLVYYNVFKRIYHKNNEWVKTIHNCKL